MPVAIAEDGVTTEDKARPCHVIAIASLSDMARARLGGIRRTIVIRVIKCDVDVKGKCELWRGA